MPLHLIKLSVGTESVEDLASWQAGRLKAMRKAGSTPRLYHTTLQRPRREVELLDGGSIYWVIKGIIQCRQRLIGFDDGHKSDGSACCLIVYDREIVRVRPTPRRAFQGWRYLDADDAPADVSATEAAGLAAMPPKLRRELADLGLI
jgi:hypothetical protein